MNYIVLDLEWNQCPDGKEKEQPLLPFEIIEIGAVKLDSSHTVLDRFHEIIRPQVYTSLHFMTREIVTLTEEDFAGKRTFPEAAADFISWCGEAPVFCTWGPGDLLELQRNFAWYHMGIRFPFPCFTTTSRKFSASFTRTGKRDAPWNLQWIICSFLRICPSMMPIRMRCTRQESWNI